METERTIMSAITKEDFEEILEMYDEPDTFKYIQALRNKPLQEYLSFLETRVAQVRDGLGHHWVVRSKENNEFIGLMNLNSIRGTDKKQIGFQLKRKFWDQGFATELTARVIEFALYEAGLIEIYGIFSIDNIASRRIFQKFNFKFEENKTYDNEEAPAEIWKYVAKQK